RKNFSRSHIRRDRPLADFFAIIGDPIGDLAQLFAKFRDWNVTEIILSIFHSPQSTAGRKLISSFYGAGATAILLELWQLLFKPTRFIIRAALLSKRLSKSSMPVRLSVTLISTKTTPPCLPTHYPAVCTR